MRRSASLVAVLGLVLVLGVAPLSGSSLPAYSDTVCVQGCLATLDQPNAGNPTGRSAARSDDTVMAKSPGARAGDVVQTFTAYFGPIAVSAGASEPVSFESADQFLVGSGVPDALAIDFVASFEGSITARIVAPDEMFFRYTAVADSRGSFLTKALFRTPNEAVLALALRITGNSADLRQTVTSLRCTIVLEGGIFDGAAGIVQTLAPDRDAFSFSIGLPYAAAEPAGEDGVW